ncbi:MAG TPA: hypothetical protein VHN80_13510 [Kineosporiaceae bacterium]|nr:hypothetical protein [Kineosporiaceae bacterium]
MASRPIQRLIVAGMAAAALTAATGMSACTSASGRSDGPTRATAASLEPNIAPSSPTPATASATDHRTIPDASAGGADEVALSAVRAWLSYDTRLDHRPNDTAARLALPWLTPALREQVLSLPRGSTSDVEWQDWTRHHAQATVQVALGGDDHPPDNSAVAWRQVTATMVLHGNDGWRTTLRQVEFLQLTGRDGRWLVAGVVTAQGS